MFYDVTFMYVPKNMIKRLYSASHSFVKLFAASMAPVAHQILKIFSPKFISASTFAISTL